VSPPLLSLQGIAKHYGAIHALRGVGFDVHAGEVLALLGDNGATKSTLIKIVVGAQPPSAGRLVMEGGEVAFAGPAAPRRPGLSWSPRTSGAVWR
jgi:ABC-type sugar transport system ATPase subunit